VIVAGRREQALKETAAANPGIEWLSFDILDRASIVGLAREVTGRFPALNFLVNNAGIMRPEKLLDQQEDLKDAEEMVATNLLGPIRLTAALLPHLKQQEKAAILNVSSGLAFVPLAVTPTYCATKAAIHSYTQSLRYQLKGTRIEVMELAPPYVATHLMSGASDPRAMPLGAFIEQVMEILRQEPAPAEICVENVRGLRYAAESGKYDAIFNGMNARMADVH
ncbi:MAG: SDR family NAD(P)-dependent oxidoreductase, partial [Terracidiphilus sp.]